MLIVSIKDQVSLLTAEERSADSRQAIAYTKIPTVSLHFPCREQSYQPASFQRDVTGRSEDESLPKVWHLEVYQPTEPQIFSLSLDHSCCQGFFSVSPFTFFSPIKRSKPSPPSRPRAERRLLSSGGTQEGGEVMSSLPLGGISLIKMK